MSTSKQGWIIANYKPKTLQWAKNYWLAIIAFAFFFFGYLTGRRESASNNCICFFLFHYLTGKGESASNNCICFFLFRVLDSKRRVGVLGRELTAPSNAPSDASPDPKVLPPDSGQGERLMTFIFDLSSLNLITSWCQWQNSYQVEKSQHNTTQHNTKPSQAKIPINAHPNTLTPRSSQHNTLWRPPQHETLLCPFRHNTR